MATHNITPDLSLFGKLGARSRAFPMVVTELVDNSLDSWILMEKAVKSEKLKTRLTKLKVRITAGTVKGSDFMVADNAGGMTEAELGKALKVAHSDKTKTSEKLGVGLLGSYGFGLKSSAMYIGPRFQIFTRSFREPNKVWYVDFDRKKFEAGKNWEIDIKSLSVDQAEKSDIVFEDGHGTYIIIENERYRSANKEGIIRRLRRTFGPRLPVSKDLKITGSDAKKFRYDEMEIVFNDDPPLLAAGPFYEPWRPVEKFDSKDDSAENTKGPKDKDPAVITQSLKWKPDKIEVTLPAPIEIPETIIAGKKIYGRIGLLDRGLAHTNKYGFDLIKNGRVIETDHVDKEKERYIGLLASNHHARVVGQLFMDDWETDHQKTEFMRDQPGLELIRKDERKKKKDEDELKTEEGQKIRENLSDVAFYIQKFLKPFTEASYYCQNPAQLFEDKVEKEETPAPGSVAALKNEALSEAVAAMPSSLQRAFRRDAIKEIVEKLDAPPTAKEIRELEETPKASTTKIVFTKPDVRFEKIGPTKPIVRYEVVEEGKASFLRVTVNTSHPFMKGREVNEIVAIGAFCAADAFSIYAYKAKNGISLHAFAELRDSILREISQEA